MNLLRLLPLELLVGTSVERVVRGGVKTSPQPTPQAGLAPAPSPTPQNAEEQLFKVLKTPYYQAYFIKCLEWSNEPYLIAKATKIRGLVTDRDTELELEGFKLKRTAAIAGFAIDLSHHLLEEERAAYLLLLRATNIRDTAFKLDQHWLQSLTPGELLYVTDTTGGLMKH